MASWPSPNTPVLNSLADPIMSTHVTFLSCVPHFYLRDDKLTFYVLLVNTSPQVTFSLTFSNLLYCQFFFTGDSFSNELRHCVTYVIHTGRRHAFLPACPSARPPCRLVPRPSLSTGQSLGGWSSCVW